MALVHFTFDESDIPMTAVNVHKHEHFPGTGDLGPMWTYQTHNGFCISDYEHNGYHDSDFYMIVWNPFSNKPENVCFASTRGWTYPSYGSRPDATPQVMEAYEAWKKQQEMLRRIASRNEQRRSMIKVARANQLSYAATKRIYGVTGRERWPNMAKLLTSKLRSGFRLSLKQQVLSWAVEEKPQYNSPLSPKQWNYI